MFTRFDIPWLASLLLAACSGEKPVPGEGEQETGDSTPIVDTSETGESGGGGSETGETGLDEYGWGKFTGAFLLGEWDEAWTCVNYFGFHNQKRWEDELCPECDFGMTITSEYAPGVRVDVHPECDWADLSSWTLGETFDTTWAFAPELQLTYYLYEGAWYPFAEYTTEVYGYPRYYIAWTFTDTVDASGVHELGVFQGFFNTASYD